MIKKIRGKLGEMLAHSNLDERVCRIEFHGLEDRQYVVEILQLQKRFAEFRALGTRGEDSGELVVNFSEIARMSYDDEYCKCLARYRMLKDPTWRRYPEFSTVKELLQFCMIRQLPVSLLADDWSFSDDFLVTDLNSLSVSLSELDFSGRVISKHELALRNVLGVWQGRPFHECLSAFMMFDDYRRMDGETRD